MGKTVLIALIRLYQKALSPLLRPACRFHPTCSEYAVEAIRGKPLNRLVIEYAFRAGMVFVLGLMLLATWNDLISLQVVDFFRRLVS